MIMPKFPHYFLLRYAARLVRVEVQACALRVAIIKARMNLR